MIKTINNITVPLETSKEELFSIAIKKSGLNRKSVTGFKVNRRSVDARRKNVQFNYSVTLFTNNDRIKKAGELKKGTAKMSSRPVIIGSGPAGLFCAYTLAKNGYNPILFERGKCVDERVNAINLLNTSGILDTETNIQFGEGGAGTFSDGKLYTRSSKRGDIREVLHQLVRFGAEPSILIDAHPHIGSDRLPIVVENIRKCITEHGGEYHFNSRVTDIQKRNDGSFDIVTDSETWQSRKVILATGHSARDIYEMFDRKGWEIQAKGFALGVRVEHPQSLINKIQYHGKYQP